MNGAGEKPAKKRNKALIKALVFVSFISAAILVARFTSVKHFLDQRFLSHFLEGAGLWAPLIFVLIYATGVCLFIPGSLLTVLGAAVFGAYRGFFYVWVGAMAGASAAFWIGRTLGRGFAASLIGDRLRKYDDAIERNGFAAVLYLRLVYFPFTPMNFGMGLTKVRFWDYFFGTALGILVGTFIFTFFVGTLRDIWASGDWGQLISFRVFFSVGLFLFSLSIPAIVRRVRKQTIDHGKENDDAGESRT